ncbi:MAG: NAD-dependent epimerase/dehydratase family protein [Bacteroidota bacterium]|nr:NAD-dependent epimerase/dehydratase family protein [Bacteroidota bacterium]
MSGIKVIITGATGMVGEGVLFECLQNPEVSEVLIVNRRHYDMSHAKLKELLVPDFFQIGNFASSLSRYDACFFCAGISSVGMKEDKFTRITYDTTMAFARALIAVNSDLVFTYVSGSHTDSSGQSRIMWARVKGKTENDLARLGFKGEYNFRPGGMQPFPGQKNWKSIYKFIVRLIKAVSPKNIITMHELGLAMINTVTKGYSKNILEIKDIKELAKEPA